MTSLSHLSIDELADGICLRAGRIAAAEAELLVWIGEFDQRGGWAGVGMRSCAQWLSWKLGLSPGAARERVRVAGKLRELPVVAEAFGPGLMSWSQARAITRVARADDGIDWVQIARSTSGAQIEQLVRGLRRAQSAEQMPEDCERAAWLVRTRKRYDADGNLVLTIYAAAEVAPVVEAAFEVKKAELERERAADVPAGTDGNVPAETDGNVPAGTPKAAAEAADQHGPDGPDGSGGNVPAGTPRHCCRRHARQDQWWAEQGLPARTPTAPEQPARVTDGDALLAIAQDTLATTTTTPDTARRTRYRLTAQIDPLSGWSRLRDGELLPPTSLTAHLKTLPGRGSAPRLRPLTPADLHRHDLGRTSRQVSTTLRELLGTLDGERCRFPGCTRHTRLHAHHVIYWSNGGPTDLDNLVLVCARHHTLIHSQGFQLRLHPDRRLQVHTADGIPVLPLPPRPWGDPDQLDPRRRITAGTLTPPHYRPTIDLDYVVSVLLRQAG